MAWSRLEKIGTIFTRVNGLIRSGALKEDDKPLWFDLYKRFPPIEEPRFDRPAKNVPVRKIFYPEDEVRAKFHRLYGGRNRENLADPKTETKCQQFIKTYNLLKVKGSYDEEEIFDKAIEMIGLRNVRGVANVVGDDINVIEKDLGSLQKETIVSSFRNARGKQDEGSQSITDINLKDIFKE
ncbi:small ribosomal subunit protein mS23 [Hetaerina americana]|uniref:small ribosomal subunit protein mS23 n=1 Tax=Hetaerina americana TaxID=62018 RepID=UPI003A7F4525